MRGYICQKMLYCSSYLKDTDYTMFNEFVRLNESLSI